MGDKIMPTLLQQVEAAVVDAKCELHLASEALEDASFVLYRQSLQDIQENEDGHIDTLLKEVQLRRKNFNRELKQFEEAIKSFREYYISG
jgi:hypothetical protein